jgi:hypothetical protein
MEQVGQRVEQVYLAIEEEQQEQELKLQRYVQVVENHQQQHLLNTMELHGQLEEQCHKLENLQQEQVLKLQL